ncbi:MAG TPA: glycosyltransferase family 2 protein, partial [Bryobacteraceae bacterium]|nr:glycosyltransferase family 2 protein [Bryobacteraceae bacterium]
AAGGAPVSVTVVVACRNEKRAIASFLESLAWLDRDGLALDAIIADGLSTDGTRRLLTEFANTHTWCRVIDNPGRIVATGLNQAIRLARGEFIVRMDAHTAYESDYVVRSIAVLNVTGASNAGGPQRSRVTGFWQRAIHAGFHSPFASGGAHFRDDDYRGPVDTVPYGCWRRDFLLGIGLFDESLVRNQDDELNARIRLAGGTIWQDPSILSWYSPRSTLRGLWLQYLQFGFWRVAVLRKHRAGSVRHFLPGAALLTGVALLLAVAAGVERQAAAAVLLILASIYTLLSAWASVRAARREGWKLLPALPITFATYQMAYATGFCAGLVYWWLLRGRTPPRLFGGDGTGKQRNRANPPRISDQGPGDSA